MSAPSGKSFLPPLTAIVALGGAVVIFLAVGDGESAARWLAAWALVVAGVAFALPYLLPASAPTGDSATTLIGSVKESRNEVINAMSILQQEIRLLQDARKAEGDNKPLRDEVARLGGEVASLKMAIMAAPKAAPAPKPAPAKPVKPAVAEEDDFDVAPLSFDDEPEAKPLPKKPAATPVAKAAAPAPVFAPEPVVDEKGLEPEDMDDDGDWLSGGLEEEDLIVTKKVDFEAIVRKDALRPKPVVDPEEQRVLREEMAQLADPDDWVGGGLQDRDVKVRKTTVNDALFDKFRAEIESKRNAKESVTGVRAPARGETALIANVTVPTGARLFVRGVGPGLDVDKGTPMQQSGHGKWQWISPEQGKPCVITIWENDQVQAEGNPVRVPGGFALTVTPTFRRKIKM